VQRHIGPGRPVGGDQRLDVEPGEDVAVEDQYRVARRGPQPGRDIADGTAGAERFVLGDVLQVEPERGPVAEVRLDVASTTWSTPAARALASWWVRKGTPAAGTMGLGVCTVSGRSRLPLPPTKRIASVTF